MDLKSFAAELLALPYRLRFGRVGRRPRLFPPLLVSGARRIRLGDYTLLEPFVALSVGGEGRIEIGAQCELRSFARLEADVGQIVLGDRCSVNPFCLLNGYGGIFIGNDVRIASHAVILSSTHRYEDPSVPIESQGVLGKKTVIGDDVWLGSHCVVVGGVRIGAHSIIGAGAVVLDDIPEYGVAAGVPARVIRLRTRQDAVSRGSPSNSNET
jgi:acetyltransferase-like isoleucine patch superfamily enzyme